VGRPWLSQTSCGLDRADLLWFGQRRAGVVLPKVGTTRQEAQPPEIAAQSCSILRGTTPRRLVQRTSTPSRVAARFQISASEIARAETRAATASVRSS
jgi:hypothetical protein